MKYICMYFVGIIGKNILTLVKMERQALFWGTTTVEICSKGERLNSTLKTISSNGDL